MDTLHYSHPLLPVLTFHHSYLKTHATDIYQQRLKRVQPEYQITVSMDDVGSYTSDLDTFKSSGLATLGEVPQQEQHHPPQSQSQSRSQSQSQPSSKPRRRRSNSGALKYRRTRSGCYTCRQRRVKCDEIHPICDRCRKGKRECTYPDRTVPSPASATSLSSKQSVRADSPAKGSTPDSRSSPSVDNDDDDCDDNDEEDDDSKNELLSTIPDDAEGEAREEHSRPLSSAGSRPSQSSTVTRDSPGSASNRRTLPMSSRAFRPQFQRSSSSRNVPPQNISSSKKWQRLPQDVEAYLRYHLDHMTYHHYAFKYDGSNFLKTTFLEIALNDESCALLYSIVAFSAYHSAIQQANGDLSTFLSYYNKTISLLHVSLQRRRYNTATLLTILQLATIEEYLGDWFHLHYHQHAALQVLTEIYRAETIMQDETRRKIILWYFRFDIFAGLMSGNEPCLSREWVLASASFYKQQALNKPNDLGASFENFFAISRLLATDIAYLFAAKKSRSISDAQFVNDASRLEEEISAFGQRLESAFTSPSCFAQNATRTTIFPEARDVDSQTIRFPYRGEYFTMNFVLLDFWAVDLMFRYQMKMTRGLANSSELLKLALRECRMIEAIQNSAERPTGSLLGCEASLALVSLLLGSSQRHLDWCRQKYATIEAEGYVYPANLRERMSRLWGVDVTRWWLPDGQGHSRMIQAIRDFVESRRGVPRDGSHADLRDMTGIFRYSDMRAEDMMPYDFDPRADSGHSYPVPAKTDWNLHTTPVTTSG